MGYYELPKYGKVLQLIFIGNYDIPFCTLRSDKPGKLNYYNKQIGREFEIVNTGLKPNKN